MDGKTTARSIELQEALRKRLEELGYGDSTSAARISRHLAEILTVAQYLERETVPLFLQISPDDLASLHTICTSLKLDIDQIADGIADTREDLNDLVEFFRRRDPGADKS